MDLKTSFLKTFTGKKVFITGHTGFKGSWLSIWLNELGAEVTGYSIDVPTVPSFFEQCGLSSKIKSIQGDVRNQKQLEDAISQSVPDFVFHLAAQPLVRRSYEIPVETFETNVLGTARLLEAVRQKGKSVRVCQIITSDKCYENLEEDRPFHEGDRLGGFDPYSASKACAELVVSSFRNSLFSKNQSEAGVSISSVRGGNVIGGGDWGTDRLIPDCIRALQKNEPVIIRNPKSTRPWQYILDILAGYLRLAEHQWSGLKIYGDSWNFGSDHAQNLSVRSLTEKIINEWGEGNLIEQKSLNDGPEPMHEARYLKLDSSKANRLLGWKHVYSLDKSLEKTVRWYRDSINLSPEETYSYSVRQIEEYLDHAAKHSDSWTPQKKTPHLQKKH